jgi:glucose-6-phosphate isomerase
MQVPIAQPSLGREGEHTPAVLSGCAIGGVSVSTPLTDFWPGPLPAPSVRTVDEMRCVLADPGCAADGPLYVMYRDCALTAEDRTWLAGQHIRFDLTVIPPATLGREYVKTKGHYHPENTAGVGYPELYQVLAGEAHYLLQAKDLSDVVAVTAHAGDVVLVPPGYGHVTINPAAETLVMANLVSTRFESEYGFYEEMRGAAYSEVEGEGWVRNARYAEVPLREVLAVELIGPLFKCPAALLYDWVRCQESLLSYLNTPEDFGDTLYSNICTEYG